MPCVNRQIDGCQTLAVSLSVAGTRLPPSDGIAVGPGVSQEKGDPAMMQAFFPIEKEDLGYRTHCAWDSNVGSVVGMALAFTGGEAFA